VAQSENSVTWARPWHLRRRSNARGCFLAASLLLATACRPDDPSLDPSSTGPADAGPDKPSQDASSNGARAYELLDLTSGATRTESYDRLIAQMNERGQRGSAYIGKLDVTADKDKEMHLHVDPGFADDKYTYRWGTIAAKSVADEHPAFMTAVGEQGAQGFLFKLVIDERNFTTTYPLYVKNASKAVTYTYRDREYDAAGQGTANVITRERWLADIQTQGSEGYRFLTFDTGINKVYSVFVKEDGSASTFSYALEDLPGDRPAFEAQLGTRGKDGFRFVAFVHPVQPAVNHPDVAPHYGGGIGGLAPYRALYERDSAKPEPLTYVLVETNAQMRRASKLLETLETQARAGFWYWSSERVGDTTFMLFARTGVGPHPHPARGTVFP
jgi:hypothetical protein